MLSKVYDLAAVTGEYTSNGQTKKHYQNMGAVFRRDDGSLCMKVESVPVGPGWNGWVNMFEPRERNQQGGSDSSQVYGGSGSASGLDDDIPFAPCWE